MNKTKENLLERLRSLRTELWAEESEDYRVALLTDTINYIEATPCTFDKNTVVQALACYRCQRCDEDFDFKEYSCRLNYSEAEMFYTHSILDEHDDDTNNEHKIKDLLKLNLEQLEYKVTKEKLEKLYQIYKECQTWNGNQMITGTTDSEVGDFFVDNISAVYEVFGKCPV